MKLVERIGLAALHRLDPERAHNLSLAALRAHLVPLPGVITSPRLRSRIAGLDLPNPVGLAAGYDKNAVAIAPLLRAGFGFVELGAVTPRPQPGNPRPRLFRLSEDRAIINRFGFNNQGMEAIAPRLAARPEQGVVGLNLGANKDSADRADDYVRVLERCGPLVDFVTVNISSPNTERLRDLQGAEALTALLRRVMDARNGLASSLPVFLKIAPDLTDAEIADIAEVAATAGVDAIIATNTTLARDGLTSRQAHEKGGLSGAPLFARSTRVLARLALESGGKMPLIGVGGVASAEDAYIKIKSGASAVQLYSAMVYNGISMIADVIRGLDQLLARDGFASVSEAVGIEKEKYA
ncbi:MAG: quinone-dependent dihydroorotate dehydrogenase [Paracoccaceae bacterium]|nr:quinone-dependent dihydroorotate dehydrogenase [Paracoccaceae bacterium]